MKILNKNKGLFSGIVLIIAVVFVYNAFFGSDVIVTDPLVTTTVGGSVLQTYTDLQRVALNQNVFNLPSYLFLTDFSATIPSQTTGRSNPFDIIGRD